MILNFSRCCGIILAGIALVMSVSGFAPGWPPSSEQLNFGLGYYEKALPRIRESALAGEPLAECYLGLMYRDGLGLDQDSGLGVRWLMKAALDGNARAQYNVALALDEGEGLKHDAVQARRWYERAAQNGSAEAAYDLSLVYREATGDRRNMNAAIDWLTRAVKLGYLNEARDLGKLYFERDRSSRDRVLGYMWFLVAGVSGDPDAMADLQSFRGRLNDTQQRQALLLAKREYARLTQANDWAETRVSPIPRDGKP